MCQSIWHPHLSQDADDKMYITWASNPIKLLLLLLLYRGMNIKICNYIHGFTNLICKRTNMKHVMMAWDWRLVIREISRASSMKTKTKSLNFMTERYYATYSYWQNIDTIEKDSHSVLALCFVCKMKLNGNYMSRNYWDNPKDRNETGWSHCQEVINQQSS